MLQNAYFLAKIGADTAENEQHFAEIMPIGRRVADGDTASWLSDVAAARPLRRPVALPPGSTEQLWARTELCIARPVLQENHLVARRLL